MQSSGLERAAEPVDPGRQRRRGRLQAIKQQAPCRGSIAPPQGLQQRLPVPLGRATAAYTPRPVFDNPTGGPHDEKSTAAPATRRLGSMRSPRPRYTAARFLQEERDVAAQSGPGPNSSAVVQRVPHSRSAATRAAAASLEPPPSPAAVGIRLIN